MRSGWGNNLVSLWVTCGYAIGLYPGFRVVMQRSVYNPGFCAQVLSSLYHHLYTVPKMHFNLLNAAFSPLSTPPITTTTIKEILSINWGDYQKILEATA